MTGLDTKETLDNYQDFRNNIDKGYADIKSRYWSPMKGIQKVCICVYAVLLLTAAFMPIDVANWKYIYNIVIIILSMPLTSWILGTLDEGQDV